MVIKLFSNSNKTNGLSIIVSLFILTLYVSYSFSLGYPFAQAQTFSNMSINNIRSTTFETFSANGLISSLIVDTQIDNKSSLAVEENVGSAVAVVKYILAGNWSLNVIDQKIRNFDINFTMVHPDGSDWHYHEISNFKIYPDIPLLLDPQGTTFTGIADIGEDNMDRWFGVQTSIVISDLNTITIYPDQEDTENHFQGQPIYGIIQSLTENGRRI
jgi:hypothetical protein